MNDEFCPHPNELAMVAALVMRIPAVRNPKQAVAVAVEVMREAHAMAYKIRADLEARPSRREVD
jgi:hypothetical protein